MTEHENYFRGTITDIIVNGQKLTNLTFGEALEAVKKGAGMRLPHWKEDVIIRCKYPGLGSDMTAPYLYVRSFRDGAERRVPCKETFPEMFSEDWEIVL